MKATGNAANGPRPSPAIVSAKAATAATMVAAPRGPKRRPAQPINGKNTNAIGTSRRAKTPHRPNISCVPTSRAANRPRTSATFCHPQLMGLALSHEKISVAVTITPSQSRNHHSVML